MSEIAQASTDRPDGGSAHLAGLFATRADLVANVVDFITPALRDPDGVAVVVATPDHRGGIIAALADAGFDPDADRCVFLDVDAVLECLLRGGTVDRDRFVATMGGILDEHLDAGRSVRVYVELAGRLWGRGEVAAAMRVEELADELARKRSFVLMCLYPMELFGDHDANGRALRTVSDAHTALVHGDLFRSGAQDEQVHLGEVLQEEAVARAMDREEAFSEADALRQLLHEAANLARSRQHFAAMVVHDIRTPTTVISGLTGVLQQRMTELDPAQVAEFLATVLRNAERIERLVDDILTVAHQESDSFRYNLVPVDLRAVVAQVATEIRQSTARTVDVSIAADLPPVLADADRQMQVLHNLLSNAAKFSPAGTPISVQIERREGCLRVHVRDQGRGIATQDLDRLFEPFARLESGGPAQVGGTGLGLYVTRLLVEGQGGTIGVASTPGSGTTFTYTVPVADKTNDHAGSTPVVDQGPAKRTSTPSPMDDPPPAEGRRPGPPARSDDVRPDHEQLEQLEQVAHRLSDADGVDDLLQRIVDLGADYLEGCNGASVILVGKNRTISAPVYSSQAAHDSTLAQSAAADGPSLDAMRHHAGYVIDDLQTDLRWPEYRIRAMQLGVRSMLTCRLSSKSQTLGVLEFLSRRPHAYSPHAMIRGQVFASLASVALKDAIIQASLERAIQSRDIIGQAKGILTERFHLLPADAFTRLNELSQHHNIPLRDIAEQVVTTGEIPD